MLKTFAIIFGIIFLLLGILGFIPGITQDGMLFGSFMVNGYLNALHIITGIIGLWMGLRNPHSSMIFFRVLGVVYVILAIVGFNCGYCYIFNTFANNPADNWLHVILGLIALYLGFAPMEKKKARARAR